MWLGHRILPDQCSMTLHKANTSGYLAVSVEVCVVSGLADSAAAEACRRDAWQHGEVHPWPPHHSCTQNYTLSYASTLKIWLKHSWRSNSFFNAKFHGLSWICWNLYLITGYIFSLQNSKPGLSSNYSTWKTIWRYDNHTFFLNKDE